MFMYVARRGNSCKETTRKARPENQNSIQVVTCKCAEIDPERWKGCEYEVTGEGYETPETGMDTRLSARDEISKRSTDRG